MLRSGWRVHPTLRLAAKRHGHFPLAAFRCEAGGYAGTRKGRRLQAAGYRPQESCRGLDASPRSNALSRNLFTVHGSLFTAKQMVATGGLEPPTRSACICTRKSDAVAPRLLLDAEVGIASHPAAAIEWNEMVATGGLEPPTSAL